MPAASGPQTEEEFLADVRPQLGDIEKIRQEKYQSYIWRRRMGTIAAVVLTPFTGFIDYMLMFVWLARSEDKGAGLTFALLAAIYAWVTAPKRAYARAYKKTIMPRIARLMGLHYDLDGKLDLDRLRSTKILPAYDLHESEDCFRGKYKGAQLAFAEIDLKQRRRGNKGRTYYVTVFKGLAIHIVLPQKKFFGHTVVRPDQVGIFEWMQETFGDLKRADLVDLTFEKKYSVFTNDQTEARYILHPVMVERISGIEQAHASRGVTLCCRDGELFILVSTKKNLFEPPDIAIPATDLDGLRLMKRDVDLTLGFIDYFEFWKPELSGHPQTDRLPA